MHALIIFQFTNHKTLDPPITQYTLESLYPNSLYHVWVAAKSKRGEGATTPSLSARTEQYCKYLFSKHLGKKIWLIGGGKSQNKNHNKNFTDHVFIILNSHFLFKYYSLFRAPLCKAIETGTILSLCFEKRYLIKQQLPLCCTRKRFKFVERFSELIKIFQTCQSQRPLFISQKFHLPLGLSMRIIIPVYIALPLCTFFFNYRIANWELLHALYYWYLSKFLQF